MRSKDHGSVLQTQKTTRPCPSCRHMLHPSWAEPTQHMHPVAHQMGQPQSGTPQVYPTQPMPQPQQAAGPFFATPAMPQPQHVAGPYYATQMAHSQHMAAHVYPTQPVVQPQHVAGPYYATQGVSQLQQMASHHAHWTGLQGYPHGTAMPQVRKQIAPGACTHTRVYSEGFVNSVLFSLISRSCLRCVGPTCPVRSVLSGLFPTPRDP